jgi:hypothetical protein
MSLKFIVSKYIRDISMSIESYATVKIARILSTIRNLIASWYKDN